MQNSIKNSKNYHFIVLDDVQIVVVFYSASPIPWGAMHAYTIRLVLFPCTPNKIGIDLVKERGRHLESKCYLSLLQLMY